MTIELCDPPSRKSLLGTSHRGSCPVVFGSIPCRTAARCCGGWRTLLSSVPRSLFTHLRDAILFFGSRNRGLDISLGRRLCSVWLPRFSAPRSGGLPVEIWKLCERD